MKEFVKVIKNMSELSYKLMELGTKLSLCVMLIGIAVYKYNEIFIGGYGNRMFSFQIVSAAWNMFVVFILGGIAVDCVEKEKNR